MKDRLSILPNQSAKMYQSPFHIRRSGRPACVRVRPTLDPLPRFFHPPLPFPLGSGRGTVAGRAVGCAKLAGYHIASVMTQQASAGTPEYVMFMAAVVAGQRNAANVLASGAYDFVSNTFWCAGIAVIVVDCGKRDPASLAHPTSTSSVRQPRRSSFALYRHSTSAAGDPRRQRARRLFHPARPAGQRPPPVDAPRLCVSVTP